MPTTVIHEIVAKKIAQTEKYSYLDNYDFYLGSIAPDAVNLEGFAEKSVRWNAHLRDSNLETWKNNIISFYNNEKEKTLFLKGYITHIMTDIIYDEYLYDEVIEKIKELTDTENPHKFMQQEMDTFKTHKAHLDVINCLKENNHSYQIRNISKDLLSKWKEKVLKQELEDRNSIFITEDIIDKLTDLTLDELEKHNIL